MDYFADTSKTPTIEDTLKYLNGGTSLPEVASAAASNGYWILKVDKTYGTWFAQYRIPGTTSEKNQIKAKLKGRAASLGLLKEVSSNNTATQYDGTTDVVYMLIR